MPFDINWQPCVDDVRALEPEIRKRIIKKVGSLSEHPFRFVGRLEGYKLFKLRVGDYRAILDIRSEENSITVVLVGHRSKVYRELSRKL